MENKFVWFESRLSGANKSFATENEARENIENAKKGYPENELMKEEDRKYWASVADKMVVVKITHIEETL